MTRCYRFAVLCFALVPSVLFSQTTPTNDSGKFRLHKFEQAIGEETYTITADGGTLTLKSDFKFKDRGTEVPLTATLKTSDNYTPQSFVINGNTSRMSTINTEVTIAGDTATIRQGKDTRTASVPQSFFTISGYAPVAVQMELLRYWRSHNSPADLATLPSGSVKIQRSRLGD